MTTATDIDYEKSWNKIKGNWTMLKGEAKKEWSKLTEDDVNVIEGRREVLQGRLQRLYGVDESEAHKMMTKFTHRIYDDQIIDGPAVIVR